MLTVNNVECARCASKREVEMLELAYRSGLESVCCIWESS